MWTQAGVTPRLGPDATGVGWIYQYVLRGPQKSLAELRSLQALGRPVARVREVLRLSNMDVGGRAIELAETEYSVRGLWPMWLLGFNLLVAAETGMPGTLRGT